MNSAATSPPPAKGSHSIGLFDFAMVTSPLRSTPQSTPPPRRHNGRRRSGGPAPVRLSSSMASPLASGRTRSRCDRWRRQGIPVERSRRGEWRTPRRTRPMPRGPAKAAPAPQPAARNKDRRTGWSARGPCRRCSADAAATSSVRPCVDRGGGSSAGSRRQQVLEPVDRGGNLGLLDRGGGIDAFGTNLRAGADEGAFPNAFVARYYVGARVLAAIAGIQIVAMCQRQRRRADETLVQTDLRAGGVAQQAVDALGELMEDLHLARRLQIFT